MPVAAAPEEWTLGDGSPGLVSYVIAAFNAGAYIEETLASCLAQDYRPLEIVVVDDGSTDRTHEIVQAFERRYNDERFRIILVQQQENAGVNAARNRGIEVSQGAYLGLLDADDLLPRRRTSILLAPLVANKADLVYGPDIRFSESLEVRDYLESDANENATLETVACDPIAKWVPNVWSFLATRQLAELVGPFSEAVRTCCPDVDHTIRIRLCQPRMLRTSAIVNLYRRVPNSMARKDRPEAVRDALLSTHLISDLLKQHGVNDARDRRWLSRRYLAARG